MGGWTLEVAKMALYVTFPVIMFHYFNQPAYFETWVTKTRRELYPPENMSQRKKFEKCIKEMDLKYEKDLLEQIEKSERAKM